MSFAVMLLVCLSHGIFHSTDAYLSSSEPEVGTNCLNNSCIKTSLITENITEKDDKLKFDEYSSILFKALSENNDTNSNESDNFEYPEVIKNCTNSTNAKNSKFAFNGTDVKDERECDLFIEMERNTDQLNSAASNSFLSLKSKYKNQTENTNDTHNLPNEVNKTSYIHGLYKITIPDLVYNDYENSTFTRIKRDVNQDKSEAKNMKITKETTNGNKILQSNIGINRRVQEPTTTTNLSENEKRIATTNDVSFDKAYEYSEEDLSVGVHTPIDFDRDLKINNDLSTKGVGSKYATEVSQFIQLLQNISGSIEKLRSSKSHSLDTLFTHNTGPAEFYIPPDCHIEWEDCKTDRECCQPLHCSELPRYPSIGSLNKVTTLEIKRFCSRFKSITFKDLRTKVSDIQEIIDTYKKKMLDVLND